MPYRALAIAPIQVDNAAPVLYELVGDSIEIEVYRNEDLKRTVTAKLGDAQVPVVEIDGRALLQAHAPTQPGEVLSGLQARAQSIAAAIFPDFSSRQAALTYEEGQKGDNYFFTWRDMNAPASFNRPFLQLAFRGSGELFAYYNTLSD